MSDARQAKPRLAGFELYFDDLKSAKCFYRDTPGLELTNEQPGHHAQFGRLGERLLQYERGAPGRRGPFCTARKATT